MVMISKSLYILLRSLPVHVLYKMTLIGPAVLVEKIFENVMDGRRTSGVYCKL